MRFVSHSTVVAIYRSAEGILKLLVHANLPKTLGSSRESVLPGRKLKNLKGLILKIRARLLEGSFLKKLNFELRMFAILIQMAHLKRDFDSCLLLKFQNNIKYCFKELLCIYSCP